MKNCAVCNTTLSNPQHNVCDACVKRASEVSVFDLVTHDLGRAKHPDKNWVTWLCPFHQEKHDGAFFVNESYNFFKCFVCGKSGGPIEWLKQRHGLSFVEAVLSLLGESSFVTRQPDKQEAVKKPSKPKRYTWLEQGGKYVKFWASNTALVREAWDKYKAVPDAVLIGKKYGYGRLPEYSSHCNHLRLIVPFISGGVVIGARARLLEDTQENCPHRDGDRCTRIPDKRYKCAKWLSPVMPAMPLYNGGRLLPAQYRAANSRRGLLCDCLDINDAHGRLLAIVENPVDADLLEYYNQDILAVATCGVTIWRDEWTKALVKIAPRWAVVMYDNDVPGNGGNAAARAAWQGPAMEANGIKLVNRLREAGAPGLLFDWQDAPAKADVGSYLI